MLLCLPRLQLLLLLIDTPPCLHAGLPRIMVTTSQGTTATHLITCRVHTTPPHRCYLPHPHRCYQPHPHRYFLPHPHRCYLPCLLSPSRVTQSSSSLLASWEAASRVRQTRVLPNTLFTAGSNKALYCSLLTRATASCRHKGRGTREGGAHVTPPIQLAYSEWVPSSTSILCVPLPSPLLPPYLCFRIVD